MYMAETKQEGNIVEKYKIGNTTILISDAAYINKTPEEIEKILQRVTTIGWEIANIARAEGKDI
jgi:oligoribonuclease NrnB/cAMP/cGMP phosphodiesterase (DHH superfamily)